jgi:diguanylate cyclase (GGDEF)-like protein
LIVIAALTVASDLTTVEASSKLKVSGTLLGLVLAAVLLGGGPAALIGVVTMVAAWPRSREKLHFLRHNIVTFAWFPLAAGLFFHGATRALNVGPAAVAYYLLIFATFVLALTLNFALAAGYVSYLDRHSLTEKAREALVPLLSAQLFSALLTMAAAYVAVRTGTTGIALLGLMLLIFQYLVGELLKSKRRGEDLHRIATTDELTGLANRDHFRTQLEDRIAAAHASGETFAVMLIDLDRFKEINDTLGHHFGDELLRQLGPRLAACVGPDGVVARLGGDEFAVIVAERTDDAAELEGIALHLIDCIQLPFSIDGMALEVGASVGISRFPRDGQDRNSLLRRADVAMYAAKDAHTGCKIYEAEFDRHSVRQLNVVSDFRRALDAGEIVVYYQPIVDVDGSSVYGAEGLVRWEHPKHGLLPPGDFIQIVEQTGLIIPLTSHVLERSIAQCAKWRRAGHDLAVAVNLSVRNLVDRGLPREIERLLTLYHLPPQSLQVEITESMLMSDPERTQAIVTRLSDLGVRISVDDFGTGYSSLANLRRLPIDELKIDRSFVSPMLKDESDLIIVRSTINLGHDLGMKVIAEGVEDGQTLARLARLGCDLVQGYHVSRPMPADAFTLWVDATDTPPPLALAG